MTRLELDSACTETQVHPQIHGGDRPLYPGNTGKGVLIGAVDSGFSYLHEDFRTEDGGSRFYSIWDQTYFFGTPPEGYAIGREFILEALDSGTAATTDPVGHGTHVMGIAAGSGQQTGNGEPAFQYVGVAPEATLIGVKTTLSEADVIDAVAYVFEQADRLEMDAVVNLSLGGQAGPHDGSGALDVALSALTGPGRILVTSAGNTADDDLHARGVISASDADGTLDFVFEIQDYLPRIGAENDLVFFDIWYEGTDDYTITLITPDGTAFGPISRGETSATTIANQGTWRIEHGVTNPGNGDVEVFLALIDAFPGQPAPAPGEYTIRFTRGMSSESPIDAWVTGANIPVTFTQGQSKEATISTPGSAAELITVGAYTTKTQGQTETGPGQAYVSAPELGALATFSSRGPLRDGSQKPDVVAPGYGIASSLSQQVNRSRHAPRIVSDGVHWILEGTSMASPMVTGMVALILSKEGSLTPAEVKSLLIGTARADGHTGEVPNFDWGHGKLGSGAADVTPPLVTVSTPNGGEALRAGQEIEIRWSSWDNHSIREVAFWFSTDDGETFPDRIAAEVTDEGRATWTVPDVLTTRARIRIEVTDPGRNRAVDVSDAGFTINPAMNEVPAALTLAPSRPNPVTGARADILFGLAQEGWVRLDVFNAAGRKVATVGEGTYPAGFHQMVWNTRDGQERVAASGVYFFRLQSQEGSLTRKLVLLR